MATIKKLGLNTRKKWVKSSVRENAITTQLLDAVFDYYPKGTMCIGGYLTDADQYWKINFHWELLVSKLTKVIFMLEADDPTRAAAQNLKAKLLGNAPDPRAGYLKDKNLGDTQDSTSMSQKTARHSLLRECKRKAEPVFIDAGVVKAANKKDPPEEEKTWWLSVAPVAKPGKSLHGTGYALDIKGSNTAIENVSRALGATVVFNEASHVHVEFANWQKTIQATKAGTLSSF